MSQDNTVIRYLTPAELLDLMRETHLISIQETGSAEGKPVIHAAVKVVNAQTGAALPGGLPFSVVMFKGAREPGFSNIAIGAVVPAAELGISLPEGFFNSCNQRFRFIRAFPLDAGAFVLQMDLFLRNATREYVKFGFGLWAAMFSQVLFELMGSSSQAVEKTVEVYAGREDIVGQYMDAIASEPPAEEPAAVEPVAPEAESAAEPSIAESVAEPSIAEPQAETATVETPVAEDAADPVAENAAEPTAEAPAEADVQDAAVEPAAAPEAKEPVPA